MADYKDLLTKLGNTKKVSPFGSSKEYKAVVAALTEVNALQNEFLHKKGIAQAMVDAHARLGEACKTYMDTRAGARTEKGRERLGVVSSIYELYNREKDAVNEMRSPAVQRENQGRRWGAVMAEQRVREIDVTGKTLRTAGAGSSTRTIVPVDGDIGFFTEQDKLLSRKGFYEKRAGEAEHPGLRNLYANLSSSQRGLDVLMATEECSSLILGTDDFKERFKQTIENDPRLRDGLGWNGLDQGTREAFLEDGPELGKYYNVDYKVVEQAGVKHGADLSQRNVASTRLAELLGQDDLLAKADRVRLKDGNTVKEGVMMARARGVDYNSTKQADINKFAKTTDFGHANFQRQMVSLEVIDFLAGQTDRNIGNMFYEFGTDAAGNPRPVGIQGIDNDAAFGEKTRFTREVVRPSDHIMMDDKLHDNISRVNIDVLKYTFGDILSEDEINALNTRFVEMQRQLPKVTKLKAEEWNENTLRQLKQRDGYLSRAEKGFQSRKQFAKEEELEVAAVAAAPAAGGAGKAAEAAEKPAAAPAPATEAAAKPAAAPAPAAEAATKPVAAPAPAAETAAKPAAAPAPAAETAAKPAAAPAPAAEAAAKAPEGGKKEISLDTLQGQEKAATTSNRTPSPGKDAPAKSALDKTEPKLSVANQRPTLGSHRTAGRGPKR